MKKRLALKISTFFFLAGAFCADPLLASHYRGTVVTVSDTKGNVPANTISIFARFTARRSYYGAPNVGDVVSFATVFDYGDGSGTFGVDMRVIAIDAVNDVVTGYLQEANTTTPGELRHTYAAPGVYTPFISDCCRVQNDPLNNNQSFRVQITVSVGTKNRCPVINAPSNVDVAPGSTLNFVLPATDQDKDPMTFRFTTAAENGGLTQPPGMTVDPNTGLITWAVPAGQTPGPYSASFSVSDGTCNLPVDMTFTVTSSASVNQAPLFNAPPTPCGQTLNAAVGVPLTFSVQATDPDAGDTVFLNNNGLPAGATFNSTSGNPASGTFSWTPTVADTNTSQIIVFTATDQNSVSALPCSVTIVVGSGASCPAAPVVVSPRPSSQGVPTRGTIVWTGTASSFTVYMGQGLGGCSNLVGTTTANSFAYSNLASNTTYSVRVEANNPGCPVSSSGCSSFSTNVPCPVSQPFLIEPKPGASDVGSPVTFRWAAASGATLHTLYISENKQPFRSFGNTPGTQLTVEVATGPTSWYVVATFGNCGTAASAISSFNAVPGCITTLTAPKPNAVAIVRTDQKYHVRWDPVQNADTYEVDVATNIGFTDARTTTTTDRGIEVSQSVIETKAFFYRVRSRNTTCNIVSSNSEPIRTVVVAAESPTLSSFTLSTEFGSVTPISQDVQIGSSGGTAILAQTVMDATTDRPWLTVTPASATLPAKFTVTADPRGLPAGSTTGTLILTPQSSATAAKPAVTVPISISLATPVSTISKTTPAANSLIVPAVAHVDGLNSVWRSDIRIANVGGASSVYRLLLTITSPLGLTLREAAVEVKPASTMALDDIVKNWFGFGPLGDGANGTLEIRPDNASASSTAASSRTYNVTSAGTFGQFIPAVPFNQFLGSAGKSLVLQPITQNAQYRTNLGIVEGTGTAVNVLAKFFDPAGTLLFSQTFAMKGGDQLQLPALLAQQNVAVNNGWLDVSLQSQNGAKVTAYTSVVDNRTGDGSLTIGTDAAARASSRFVVAGVGKTVSSAGTWQSDVTLLNTGGDPVDATLTFVPQGSTERPTATVHLAAHENKVLADVADSVFGMRGVVGAIDIDTTSPAPLLIEARTFNVRSNGTVGQALPGFTRADAASLGGRRLQLLNIEESERYRSNLGMAEVTGRPVTVEVTGYAEDSLASPVITLSLGANEFVQMSSILTQLGFGRTYNGRVSVSVVNGPGAVAAYISAVDNGTDDPTYIPAQ